MKITPFLKRQNSVFLTTLIGLILIGILICLPTGYEDAYLSGYRTGGSKSWRQIILQSLHPGSSSPGNRAVCWK